eukprot:2309731-Pleurochrysis_carterae.AAC.1
MGDARVCQRANMCACSDVRGCARELARKYGHENAYASVCPGLCDGAHAGVKKRASNTAQHH